jgi:limonene-1,2-epoxide hydrolase
MFHARRTIAVLLTAGFLAMAAGAPARADTNAQKVATVREMLRAWHELNWDRVYALFSEDGVLHSMMSEPIVGREAIRQHLGPMAGGISSIDLKVAHIGVVGGLVIVERVDDFVFKGHHGAVPVVGVLDVQNGHVREWREYYDRNALMLAMGVAPASGQH